MFGLIESAHLQMRALLPPRIARDFDIVLKSVQEAMPSHFDDASKARAAAIIMGAWLNDRVSDGDFSLPLNSMKKVEWLIDLCERYNQRDIWGDGRMANILAHDILQAIREYHDNVSDPRREVISPSPTEEELHSRKLALDERLKAARSR